MVLIPKKHPVLLRLDPSFGKYIKKFKVDSGSSSVQEASVKLLKKIEKNGQKTIRKGVK